MEAAVSLMFLCVYKLLAWFFWSIGFVFKLGNIVIKTCNWSLDMIHEAINVLIYLVTEPFTWNKKLVYAWGFCSAQRNKLVRKLRDKRMHT